MSETELGSDKPVRNKAMTFGELYHVAQHPAVRLGFLDAQSGRPFDHEFILQRIERETPPKALARIGWGGLFSEDAALAQYRYEEGRALVVERGLRCRGWGHPDFLPAQVRDYIIDRAVTTPPRTA